MPAPTSAQIELMAKGAFSSAQLNGKNIPDLTGALGQTLGQALAMFASMAMIAPGIPATVDPTSGTGSTVGPGTLLPPPAGGPAANQIEPLALGALTSKQINGEQKSALAKVIAQSVAQAITLFTTVVMVAPGISIAGFVSAAPGMLMGSAPAKPMLQPIVLGFASAEGLRGKNIPDFAGALAETIANALSSFMTMVKVSPGIPATPAATAGPGRLI